MPTPAPDLSTLTLPQLRAWSMALRGAEVAMEAAGGGGWSVAVYADAEGVSVAFTVPVQQFGDSDA